MEATEFIRAWRPDSSQMGQIINQNSLPDQLIVVVTFACCCLSALFSLMGNGMVLYIICGSRTFRRSPTFLFIANICVSDLIISTLVVPFQFQVHLLHRWIIPWFLCYVCPTIQVCAVSNSVFSMTAIAIERCRAVLSPLKVRLTKGQAKIEIAFIWFLSVLLCIPTWFSLNVILHWDPITGQNTLAQCDLNQLYADYNRVLLIVHYFLPLIIISYCYIRMAIELRSSIHEATDMAGHSQLYCETLKRNKRKVVKMLFFVVLLFMVCWLPIQIIFICKEIWPQVFNFRYFNVIKFACNWLAVSSSCFNPYLYIFYNERFRNAFRRKFCYVYYVFCSMRNETLKLPYINNTKESKNISY